MEEAELFRRRSLPHWDVPGATYFITSCLEGSIPVQGLLDIRRFQKRLQSLKQPPELSKEQWELKCWKQTFGRIDQWLDGEPAINHLADPDLATIVMDSLLHFDGT